MQNRSMTAAQTVERFLTDYFIAKDVKALPRYMTEDVRWLGAADAEDALLTGKSAVLEMFGRTLASLPDAHELRIKLLDETELGENETSLFVRMEALKDDCEKPVFSQRVQFLCRREKGMWKVCCVHGSVYYDTVKQQLVRNRIKSSETELDNIVNAIPGGIAVLLLSQREGMRVVFYSDGVAELCGYTREEYDEIIAADPLGTVLAEDRERLAQAIRQGVRDGSRTDVTYRCASKDGSPVWISAVVQLAGRQGDAYVAHAMFTGVPKQLDLLQSIMDETETCIYVVDSETFEIYYANNAMKSLLRFSDKDYSEKKCYELFFGNKTPCENCGICLKREYSSEVKLPEEFGGRIARVRDRHTSWMGRPSMIRYAVDITDRKAAEKTLKKEQDRYRFIVENAGSVIFDWDLLRNTTYTSGDFKHYVVGKQPADDIVKNRVAAAAVHPDDLHLLQQFGRDARSGMPYAEATLRAAMLDGSYRWTTVSVNNVCDSEGRRIRVIGTLRDVDDAQAAVYDRQLALMRLKTIVEDTNILYWEVDIKAKRAVMGETTKAALGTHEVFENYPESLFEADFFPSEYAESYRQLHRDIENGAEYAEMRLPLNLAGGREKWFRVRYHALYDVEGSPEIAIGTALDITELVNAERQYRELAGMQDALAQHAYKFYLFNLTKNLVESAQSQEQRTRAYAGMSYDDYLLASAEHMADESRQAYLKTFGRKRLLELYDTGTTFVNGVVRNITEQHKEISMEISMSLTRNPTSGDVMAFSYGIDVTRQKMEQTVIEAVTTYDFDLIALIDLDADSITMFKRQEDRFEHLNSWSPEGFTKTIALSAQAYVIPEDRELFLRNSSIEVIRRELQSKNSYEFTFRFFGENGAIRIKKSRYATTT